MTHRVFFYDHICRDVIDNQILKKNLDINATGIYHGRKDFTLLHAAVANSDDKLVKYVLTKNININATTSYNETALHIAAERNNLDIVDQLIAHGADISAVANYGLKQDWTPLHCAIRYRNENIVQFLLNRGAKFKVSDCECALHFSVKLGILNIIELLFKHYDVRLPCICQDLNDPSLLYLAVQHDHEEVVKFLIKKYNNVRRMIKSNELILHLAVRNNYYQVVKELLHGNVDVNISDSKKNHTALDVVETTAISNILKRHLIKLKVINYHVSEDNFKKIKTYGEKFSKYRNECEEELKIIKREKINDSNVSFYDILNKSIHQIAIFMTNKQIREIVSDTDDIDSKYPIYGPIIVYRLREGLIRKNLIDKIQDFIFNTFSELPNTFVRNIFSYLSHDDIEKLSVLCTENSIN
ncbi:serine/threonine-protein kinase TNNI3K-like [Microplitis mediator]|uniref:serine/threonine-protein kinase TNNI3K-like n=1 Tax=Microplitis mediator TaxID=375433 RepID=UPI0025550EF3|nr:serine/threonine-protein kinase TNNI3K-like [Microplitis mediator]XP_057334150.1 serine/threonine-protein kinase TNNI3K-like [Microplitis mediator]